MAKIQLKYADMSPSQRDCFELLCAGFGGVHQLDKIYQCGSGIEMITSESLATFDGNLLTVLVIIAHDRNIRLEISASAPGRLKIKLHKRKKDGAMHERHDSIETAIKNVRHSA